MKQFEELNKLVIEWANDKEILTKATPLTQCEKTDEEVKELFEALHFQNNNLQMYRNIKGEIVQTQDEIKDAIGDILVTVLIQAKMQNLNPLECLQSAYDVISKRTGSIVNGKFEKDKK